MKRNYIIPTTESIAFRAGFICQTGSGSTGTTVTGNTDLGIGGNVDTIDPM